MKKIILFCALTLICAFTLSAQAQSDLTYFDTVIDLNEVDEATRAEYFKKIAVSAKEESENQIFYTQSQAPKENINTLQYSNIKDIMKVVSQPY